MKISQISQFYAAEFQKAAGNKQAVSKSEKSKKGDFVSVSKQGKVLNDTNASVEVVSNRIENLSEIRWEKVNRVKEKVQNGFYDTQELREALADRLIKDFGLENQ